MTKNIGTHEPFEWKNFATWPRDWSSYLTLLLNVGSLDDLSLRLSSLLLWAMSIYSKYLFPLSLHLCLRLSCWTATAKDGAREETLRAKVRQGHAIVALCLRHLLATWHDHIGTRKLSKQSWGSQLADSRVTSVSQARESGNNNG